MHPTTAITSGLVLIDIIDAYLPEVIFEIVLLDAMYNISLCLQCNSTLIHNISLAFKAYKKFIDIYNVSL